MFDDRTNKTHIWMHSNCDHNTKFSNEGFIMVHIIAISWSFCCRSYIFHLICIVRCCVLSHST
uniref:Uncharacterized protein n=1 Tax=Parascaris equorum TaxID=6256 RepID=A0A914RYE9_PAREQ